MLDLPTTQRMIQKKQRVRLRMHMLTEVLDPLAGQGIEDVSFEDKTRIIQDLGLEVKVSWRLWALNWSIPVVQFAEKDFSARIGLTGVEVGRALRTRPQMRRFVVL